MKFFFKYTVDYSKQRHYAVHRVLIKKKQANMELLVKTGMEFFDTLEYTITTKDTICL